MSVRDEWVDKALAVFDLYQPKPSHAMKMALAAVAPLIRRAALEEAAGVVKAMARELRDNDAYWGGPPTSNSATISPALDKAAAAIRALDT